MFADGRRHPLAADKQMEVPADKAVLYLRAAFGDQRPLPDAERCVQAVRHGPPGRVDNAIGSNLHLERVGRRTQRRNDLRT